MATITADQSKLVLNAFAAIFQNNLVISDAVTWKKYDGEFNDRNGFSVSEQVPPRYNVTHTTGGVKDLSSGVQDSVFGSEQYTVNDTFGVDMGWSDFAAIQDIGDARQSEALKAAAGNLAEQIDSYVLGFAQKQANNWLGTPANSVAAWADFAQGYTRLKEEGVDDADLRAILTYADKQALGSTVLTYTAPDALVTGAFRKGFTGEVDGIPSLFTQQLPSITMGTRTASGVSTLNGASQNVDYADVAISAAPGQYMTQDLLIKVSASGTETVKAGEVFTIAGVYAYDNRAQVALTRLQQFTVLSDVTAVSGAATVKIFPAIIVPNTGTGGDVAVNTANATCSAVPASNAAIIWTGTASTAYRPRLILQKQAIVVNTMDLMTPYTDTMSRVNLTNVPVSVRMWKHSDFNTGAHSVRFDVALTANVRDRRRMVRINGN